MRNFYFICENYFENKWLARFGNINMLFEKGLWEFLVLYLFIMVSGEEKFLFYLWKLFRKFVVNLE